MSYNRTVSNKNKNKNSIRSRIRNGIEEFVKKINETRKMLKNPLISKQIKNIACDTGVNIKYGMTNTARNLYYALPIISLLYKHPGNPPKQSSCGVTDEPPVETTLDESTIVAATLASARNRIDDITGKNMGNAFNNAGQAAMNFAKDIPPIGAITGANSIAQTAQNFVTAVKETSEEISKTQKKLTGMMAEKPQVFIGGPNGIDFKSGIGLGTEAKEPSEEISNTQKKLTGMMAEKPQVFIGGPKGIDFDKRIGLDKYIPPQQGAGRIRIIKRANKTRKIFRNS